MGDTAKIYSVLITQFLLHYKLTDGYMVSVFRALAYEE